MCKHRIDKWEIEIQKLLENDWLAKLVWSWAGLKWLWLTYILHNTDQIITKSQANISLKVELAKLKQNSICALASICIQLVYWSRLVKTYFNTYCDFFQHWQTGERAFVCSSSSFSFSIGQQWYEKSGDQFLLVHSLSCLSELTCSTDYGVHTQRCMFASKAPSQWCAKKGGSACAKFSSLTFLHRRSR